MSLHIFGIRHHGPGCARSLHAALDELSPDVVVIETPADAEEVLSLAAHENMKPPVALLLYSPDEPGTAVYYPLTVFSPEWQAIRWALNHNVPVRSMDLPHSISMALAAQEKGTQSEAGREPSQPQTPEAAISEPSEPPPLDVHRWRTDPLALIAEAAGYKDHELWWEQQIERRANATGLFEAINEVMRAVRNETGETSERDLLREAFMRKMLREVVAQGFERIAVVCGAWHAPVLDEEALVGKREGCRAKDDNARLKGLPKLKTTATWIPWTHSRMTYRSGYGAGVHSPGWYAHVWHARDQAPTRWIATAARLLREKDLDASSASIIEATRLADALAAIRELQSPGLAELNQAILTVLCHGDLSPMHLIRDRLEIGDVLGKIPEDAPTVPLARDVAAWQKRLRLAVLSEIRHLDLDLRKENDLARSHLLHRLQLLGIEWGRLQQSGSRTSTFHEIWTVEWQPEFSVAMIEANVWGNTVESAAVARVIHQSQQATDLVSITDLLESSMLAGLESTVDPLLVQIQNQAAVSADLRHLMDALLPLARVARYGNVRGTQAEHIIPIIVRMFQRVLVDVTAACASLDDDAAAQMLGSIHNVQQSLDILNRDDLQQDWQAQLFCLAESDVHARLRGWCCRLLLEKGALSDEQLYRSARLALSPANPPAQSAGWVMGLLQGSGMLLLQQDNLWHIFDHWLRELATETFTEMLPLLRRAFAEFSSPERRQMGEKVKHLSSSEARTRSTSVAAADIDVNRAKLALPILAHILGISYERD